MPPTSTSLFLWSLLFFCGSTLLPASHADFIPKTCAHNYYPDHGPDSFCDNDYPICKGAGGVDIPTGHWGTECHSEPGAVTACECAIDDDCPDYGFCADVDGTIGVGRTPCMCFKCVRDSYPTGIDSGCSLKFPKCVGATEIPTCFAGNKCVGPPLFCLNDAPGGSVDNGCNFETPICVDDTRMHAKPDCPGEECVKCINDADGDDPDSGCHDHHIHDKRLCVLDNGTEPPKDKPGTKCALCLNNREDLLMDVGCSPFSPICKSDDGTEPDENQAGERCFRKPKQTSS